jgi:hypothetical protein
VLGYGQVERRTRNRFDGRSHRDGKFAQVYWVVEQDVVLVVELETALPMEFG